MKKYKNHIITPSSIIIMYDTGNPDTLPKSNPEFDRVIQAIRLQKWEEIPKMADRIARLSNEGYEIVDGRIQIRGVDLPEALSKRIIQFVEQGLPPTTFLNFWANLSQNPSEDSRKDLFNFLEANHVPLTEDGCFIAYKKVKEDYWDSWTGESYQYKPGSVVKMDRSLVNSNRHETCAPGLHVAGFGYAKDFTGSKMIEVKINPKNVVAVPIDYNNTKIRVCELEVIRDCQGYMAENVQQYDEDEAIGFVDDDEDYEVDYSNDICDDCDEYMEDCLCDDDELEDELDELDELEELEDELEEPVTTVKIRRIPSWLKWLVPSVDGRIRVPLAALEKIDVDSGDAIYAIANKNSVVLESSPPSVDDDVVVKKINVGTASARIPASLFRRAGIHRDEGYTEYALSCSKGKLIIRAN